jgi:hypothetical protein
LYGFGEILILLTTAATTLAAAFKANPWATSVLAATSLVIVGQKRIFNWHDSWLALSSVQTELQVAINEYRLSSMNDHNAQAQRKLVERLMTSLRLRLQPGLHDAAWRNDRQRVSKCSNP